jgi:hypothetical protein
MPRKYTRTRRRPRRTYTTRRRTTSRSRARKLDPVAFGAQVGGLLGLVFVAFGLLRDKLPEEAEKWMSSGFAISLGVVLLVVAISIYFSQEAGWFDKEPARRSRRTRTYRRRRS